MPIELPTAYKSYEVGLSEFMKKHPGVKINTNEVKKAFEKTNLTD